MADISAPMITVPFQGRLIHLPRQMMNNDVYTPNMMVQIGSGNKHLTSSTLHGFEHYSIVYHMEYEMQREADHDAASQIYTANIPCLSDVIFALPAETVQADLFNLLIQGIPVDLVEFVELQNVGVYNEPREIVSFMNCIITGVRRYNTSWDAHSRNNLILIAMRATQWSLRVVEVDQSGKPKGTGAVDYRFEGSAVS